MWSVLRGGRNPVLVGGRGSNAARHLPPMVSLAVLAALSRANGGGYVAFLNFCAYF